MDGQLRVSAALTTRKSVARPHSVAGWVELRTGLHVWEQYPCSCRESNSVSMLILSSKYAAVSQLLLKYLRQIFVKTRHITVRQARPP